MEKIKAFILTQLANKQITKEQAKLLLLELSESHHIQQDIAIIGLAGRFSEAKTIDEFWEFLKIKKNCIRDFPKSRKEDMLEIFKNPYFSEFMLGNAIKPEDLDHMYSQSGYLDEIDKFDAKFFGIPPTEATYMDPNQRITLEVAWEAIENAGYGGDCLKGTKTGVFVGRDQTNYSFYRMCSDRNPMQLSGSWEGMVASRISYILDLKGPCIMTDTACSAGMVSVHLAIQSLLTQECDMALAGGINLSSIGEPKSSFLSGASMNSVESSDETIRTFDARANGTLWAEGAGIVLLKPLKKALEDGDNIRAIIKATAINNDGMSNSITAPNAITQEQVIVDTWNKAAISPETVTYMEAHGTGTVLGDPIEIRGLTNAFRRFTKKNQFCALGSLKTNMGHAVAASGIASLAKVVKSLEDKLIAPISNFNIPNPYINFLESPLYINDELKPWETDQGVRRAAINSFGFIRTNCHAVLEEGPKYTSHPQLQEKYLFTLSGKNESVLKDYVDKYVLYLNTSNSSLPDICYTSNTGRGHYEYRLLVIVSSLGELKQALESYKANGLTSIEPYGIYYDYHSIVSDKKRNPGWGEITVLKRNEISNMAMHYLEEYLVNKDAMLLQDIARLYIQGANLNWNRYYVNEKRNRVPIPTYPLQKIRYWAAPMITKVKSFSGTKLHPLVERKVSGDKEEICYETSLSVKNQWVLKDHRIDNKSVLPGTTYLEIVRHIISEEWNSPYMEFKNVFFLVPLFVEEDETVTIQIVINQKNHNFKVISCKQEQWSTHVEGEVELLQKEEQMQSFDMNQFKKEAINCIDPFIGESDTGVFQFGKHWDVVRAVWNMNKDTLALLELPQELKEEVSIYQLHPSLLDNAVNLISQISGKTFLPYMYKSLKLYHSMPDKLYSHIQIKRDNSLEGETITYDINLYDIEGNVFAKIQDYTVKKVDFNTFKTSVDKKTYTQLDWVPCENSQTVDSSEGNWAVVMLKGDKAEHFMDTANNNYRKCIPYYLDDFTDVKNHIYSVDIADMDNMVKDFKKNQIHGCLFATEYISNSLIEPNVRQRYGLEALLLLTKSLLTYKVNLPFGLKILVQSSWYVDKSDKNIDPYSAATASLGKVIGQEYENLSVDIIDADDLVPLEQIMTECFDRKSKNLRAIRTSGVFSEKLYYKDAVVGYENQYKADGAYVISGGLGGLGLEVAKDLVEKGAKNIILMGRHQIAGKEKWKEESEKSNQQEATVYNKLLDLELIADNVEYLSCDVSNAEEVMKVSTYIDQKYNRIQGIIHAAGMAGDGYLLHKSIDNFRSILKPKIDGSLNLLQMAKKYQDCFLVLFSSITAITGGEGQGDYCCGNAFMDALACMARIAGIPAISINWPSWEEVGMSVQYGIRQEDTLFQTIKVKEGLKWLDYFMMNPSNRMVPSECNIPLLKGLINEVPFLLDASIISKITNSDNQRIDGENKVIQAKMKGISNPNMIQSCICNIYASVLGLEEIDIFTSFQEMGGNSLMTTQLLKLVGEAYPNVVEIADLFSYPSVSELSAYIEEQIGNSDIQTDTQIEDMMDNDIHPKNINIMESNENNETLMEALAELGDSELFDIFQKR